MFNFYKDVIEYKGKLLVRGVHEGKEFKEKVDFNPYFICNNAKTN